MRPKERIRPFMEWLTKQWENNQDLRFGQLLINMGLAPDGMKLWGMDTSDYNISHKHLREFQTWGTYGKDGKDELHFVLIKDMDEEHIKSALETQKHISNTRIQKILEDELKFREE